MAAEHERATSCLLLLNLMDFEFMPSVRPDGGLGWRPWLALSSGLPAGKSQGAVRRENKTPLCHNSHLQAESLSNGHQETEHKLALYRQGILCARGHCQWGTRDNKPVPECA